MKLGAIIFGLGLEPVSFLGHPEGLVQSLHILPTGPPEGPSCLLEILCNVVSDQVDLGSMVELNLLVVEQSQEASLKLFQDAGIIDGVQYPSHTNLVDLTDSSVVPANKEL